MPVGGNYFSSVKKARAALKERAHEIVDGMILTIKKAASEGDFESAIKGYQFLMEHMPEDEGERLIDISVDKPKQVESGPRGPAIQIGVAIGGVTPNKAMPEASVTVIDVTPEDSSSNS